MATRKNIGYLPDERVTPNGHIIPKPRPRKSMPDSMRKRKPTAKVDAVRAGQVSEGKVCPLCGDRYKRGDSIMRLLNLKASVGDMVMFAGHRRCVEAMLSVCIEDDDTENKRFQEYRAKIAAEQGLTDV